MSLDELALKYGTDKGSTDHSYTRYYEQLLAGRQVKSLLELGVWKGASLRMWRCYFDDANIVGLDRNPPRRDLEGIDVEQVQGDQNDPNLIESVALAYGPFDVIIDDASHISSVTIKSFQQLYPHLRSGGLYVIEDLQTSYDVTNYGKREAAANPDWKPDDGYRQTAMQFCKRLADEVNRTLFPPVYRLGYELESVQFFPNICFITKA